MGIHAKTAALIAEAYAVLSEQHPMTLRQCFYQLVARQAIENTAARYDALGDALVGARQRGEIPWDWMEDRLRLPRTVSMWDDLGDFAETARRAYRRDVWATQPGRVEVWLEKDALSGVFTDICEGFGVTLNVSRGYDSWDAVRNAAGRFDDGGDVTVLHFGDFDPSGADMVRSLRDRLEFFGASPEIVRCALTSGDITRYSLPPAMTKKGDSRAAAFVAVNGDRCVELDALPVAVLRGRLKSEIETRLDLDALAAVRQQEAIDRAQLVAALVGL